MKTATLNEGQAYYLKQLMTGAFDENLGGKVENGKKKSRNTHHWAMKGRKRDMKKPNLMGEYKPVYTLTGERL